MDSSTPDAVLITAVLAGEPDHFGIIVNRYRGAIWRAAKSRLGTIHAADDAVQETFLCAFRWLRTYDSRFSFRTWLWTILFNQCRRSLAKTARRREVHAEDHSAETCWAQLLGREATPPEHALLQERAELLERLLQRLPDSQADALRLRFFGDLKFQEIADVLQCSLGTAKNRVRAGLLQLAAWLGEDDDPGTLAPRLSAERESR